MYLSTTKFEGSKSKSIFGLPELYYTPQKVKLCDAEFETEPSITEMMERYFMTDGETYYGHYAGLKSLNNIHGTTQVPATIEIKSNNVDKETMYEYGYTKYIIYPSLVEISSENYIYMEILDDIETLYEYFEEDIVECIKYLVDKVGLSKQKFEYLLDSYSERTREVIDNVFA